MKAGTPRAAATVPAVASAPSRAAARTKYPSATTISDRSTPGTWLNSPVSSSRPVSAARTSTPTMPSAHPAPAREIDVRGSARRRPRSPSPSRNEPCSACGSVMRRRYGPPSRASGISVGTGRAVRHSVAMSDWPSEPPPQREPTGPPAPGWWLASDGRYYPPEQAPGAAAPPPPAFTAYTPYAPGPIQGTTSTNGLAIAAMVLGILWIYWIGSVLALVFGYVAKGQIDRSAGRQGGRGMAIAGIVLGWIGLGLLALVIVIGLAVSNDDSFDNINSDPSDGVCNEERFLEDPDC